MEVIILERQDIGCHLQVTSLQTIQDIHALFVLRNQDSLLLVVV
jgi:hypothetical protein